MSEPSSSRRRFWLKVLVFVAIVVAANVLTGRLVETLNMDIRPSNEDMVHRLIMMASVAYSMFLAIPFVPGAEIGLALLMVLGAKIAGLVYLCTIVGLSLSFAVGRLTPMSSLIRLADEFRLERLSALLHRLDVMNAEERLAHLASTAPHRFVPFLLRYRYIALALAISVPGNIVIGGGGGISLFAGCSRLYSIPGFLLTIGIAVAPIPLMVLVLGDASVLAQER